MSDDDAAAFSVECELEHDDYEESIPPSSSSVMEKDSKCELEYDEASSSVMEKALKCGLEYDEESIPPSSPADEKTTTTTAGEDIEPAIMENLSLYDHQVEDHSGSRAPKTCEAVKNQLSEASCSILYNNLKVFIGSLPPSKIKSDCDSYIGKNATLGDVLVCQYILNNCSVLISEQNPGISSSSTGSGLLEEDSVIDISSPIVGDSIKLSE